MSILGICMKKEIQRIGHKLAYIAVAVLRASEAGGSLHNHMTSCDRTDQCVLVEKSSEWKAVWNLYCSADIVSLIKQRSLRSHMACSTNDKDDKCVQNIGQETWVEKDSYETQVQLLG
jgi:hypothetical protein